MTEQDGTRELDRLIFFSDAVFAIVMTLLVLDINVPSDLAADDLPDQVLGLWPKLFGYVLSFLVIGTYWIAHHRIFRYIRSYDRTLMWLNLLFLLSISFVPFPTSLLGDYGDQQFAVVVYAASLGLARLLLSSVWWYAMSGPISMSDDFDARLTKYHIVRGLAIPIVFLISIGISFFSVNAAVASWFVMFVADVAIWRLYSRRHRSSDKPDA